MHNVEQNGMGNFAGWVSGRADGCPSYINLSCSDHKIQVIANRERVDVLRSGFTRFSGFDLRISTHSHECPCRAELEETEYKLVPSVMLDTDLVKFDNVSDDSISGWINCAINLRSLSFYNVLGAARAEIHLRLDINALLNTPSEFLHGFRLQALDVSRIFAVNINNSVVHWFAPDLFESLHEGTENYR